VIAGIEPRPLTYLVLIGDGLHNFLGGLAVAAAFMADVRVGIGAWLAAAAHEIPQELGDFGVLVHGGWERKRALLYNVISASTFLVGGLLAYAASARVDVRFLVPFAAGNFIYIAASDLVPEVKHNHGLRHNAVHLLAFVGGIALLYLLMVLLAA
jgi:zinc and cadmium transporter